MTNPNLMTVFHEARKLLARAAIAVIAGQAAAPAAAQTMPDAPHIFDLSYRQAIHNNNDEYTRLTPGSDREQVSFRTGDEDLGIGTANGGVEASVAGRRVIIGNGGIRAILGDGASLRVNKHTVTFNLKF